MALIHPYRLALDETSVFDLRQGTFGVAWPLTYDVVRRVTVYHDGDHLMAEQNGASVGCVATQAAR